MKNEFLIYLLWPIKGRILYALKQYKWRKKNRHNRTTVSEGAPIEAIKVGKETYGMLNVHWYGQQTEFLTIGNFCSIAQEVHFVLGGEHSYNRLTNFPFPELVYHTEYDGKCKGPIVIEDDVWIGFGSIILSGVTLGRGCVIGAGSVVVKDIPPYALFAGGKIIKYRFSDQIIEKLLKVDYEKFNYNTFEEYCRTNITEENIDEITQKVFSIR